MAIIFGVVGVGPTGTPLAPKPADAALSLAQTSFEIDGNTPEGDASAMWGHGTDWDTILPSGTTPPYTTASGYRSTGILRTVAGTDDCMKADGNSLTGDLNNNTGDLNGWATDKNSPTPKGDLCGSGAAYERVSINGQYHTIFYAYWTRNPDASGEISVFYYLEGGTAGRCDDLLLKYNYDSSSKTATASYLSWKPTVTGACDPGQPGTWIETPLSSSMQAAVGVNLMTDGDGQLRPATFGEMAIDLTILGLLPEDQCRSYTLGPIVSQTGEGENATPTMQDYIAAPGDMDITNCSSLKVTKEMTDGSTPDVSFPYLIDQADHHPTATPTTTSSPATPWTLVNYPDGNGIESTIKAGQTVTWSNIMAQPDYQVTELLDSAKFPAGFQEVSVKCIAYDQFHLNPDGTPTAQVSWPYRDGRPTGETFPVYAFDQDPKYYSSCVITNTSSYLKVVKAGSGDSTVPFAFTASPAAPSTDPAQANPFQLTIGDTSATMRYTPGTQVTITEAPLPTDDPAWSLKDVSCSGTKPSTVVTPTIDLATGRVTVTTVADDTITCTFSNEQAAKATLVKKTIDGDGTFNFTLTPTAPAGHPVPVELTTTGGTSPVAPLTVEPDTTYKLTEADAPGWTRTAFSCPVTHADGTTGVYDPVAGFKVLAGDVITCTATNTKNADLTLHKNIVDNYGGGATTQNFILKATASNGTAVIEEYDPAANDAAIGAAKSVPAGTYILSETAVAGYSASTWTCVDAQTNPVQVTGGAVTVTGGQSVACTITNTAQPAHLTLVKEVDNTNGGTAQAEDWTLTASGSTRLTGSGGATGEVHKGTYTLSEAGAVPGYTNGTTWVCTGTGFAQNGDQVTMELGGNATCTVTNVAQPGTLTIVKNTEPNSGQAFTFTGSGPIGSFELTDDGTPGNDRKTFTVPTNATYTVTETAVPGWDLTDLQCTTGTNSTATTDKATGAATITVAPGENVTCTYTNTQRGQVEVTKAVTDVAAGYEWNFQFTLTPFAPTTGTAQTQPVSGTGPGSAKATFTNLLPGTYTLAEVNPGAGWTSTLNCGEDADPADGYQVVVGAAGKVTCTATNKADTGTLTVEKSAAGIAPGTDWTFQFTLTPGGAQTVSNNDTTAIWNGLLAGQAYTLTETPVTGWVPELTCEVQHAGETTWTEIPELTTGAGYVYRPGDKVECTALNTNSSSLTVVKQIVGGRAAAGDQFTVWSKKPNTEVLGEATTSGTATSATTGKQITEAGAAYTVGETADGATDLSQYTKTITCVDATGRTTGLPDNQAYAGAVTLPAAVVSGDVTCTITNTAIPASLTIKKNPGTATSVGNGTYDVTYTITVTNSGGATGTYDLTDTVSFGAGVRTVSASSTQASGPTAGTLLNTWNAPNLTILEGGTIPGNATQTFTVTVRATVDPTTITKESATCSTTGTGTSGGFLNTATLSVGDDDSSDDACIDVPAVKVEKEATGTEIQADGKVRATYDITVTNTGAVDTSYNLSDELKFATGVSVSGQAVTEVSGGAKVTEEGWNGIDRLDIAKGVEIVVDGVHVYRVVVYADVPSTITNTQGDCTLTETETGTGFLNRATLTYEKNSTSTDACTPAGKLTVQKDSSPPVPDGEGAYAITYTVTVANHGAAGATYSLTDDLKFSADVNIVAGSATATGPNGAITGWPASNVLATNVQIGPGTMAGPTTHTYTVTVKATVRTTITAESGNCELVTGEAGTGFFNSAKLTQGAYSVEDTACEEAGTVTMSKVVAPNQPTRVDTNATGDPVYTVEYILTVTNSGAVDRTYELNDTLRFGGLVTPPTATIAPDLENAPKTPAVTDGWDGLTDVTVQPAGTPIAAGDRHIYKVTATATVKKTLSFTESDCAIEGTETGSGFTNEATMTVEGRTTTAKPCAPIPNVSMHKDVVGQPNPLGNGRYEVTYYVMVQNSGAGTATYDLADTVQFRGPITIVGEPTLTYPVGVTGTQPTPAWNGTTQTTIISGATIGAGTAAGPATHTYQVVVEAHVADTATPADVACQPENTGGTTGFLNRAALTVAGETIDDDACAETTTVSVTKTLRPSTAAEPNPKPLGGGKWTIVYDVVVANNGLAATTFGLSDQLRFGQGVSVQTATVTAMAGAPDPNADTAWDGTTNQVIVKPGATLPAQTQYTYQVTVTATVSATMNVGAAICPPPNTGGSGGFLNVAVLTSPVGNDTDDACAPAPIPRVSMTKELGSVDEIEGQPGKYTVTYSLRVSNTGNGATTFGLTDTLAFGSGVAVESAEVTGQSASADWNGQDQPVVVLPGQSIGAGETLQYNVTVTAVVDSGTITTDEADCSLITGSPDRTGFLNRAVLTTPGGEVKDDACGPVPSATVSKTVQSVAPGEGGTYTIVYVVTATNNGAVDMPVEVRDEMQYGEGMTIESAVVKELDGAAPHRLTWTGTGENTVLSPDGFVLPAGERASYEVTVVAKLDVTTITVESADCVQVDQSTGTGFLNSATLNYHQVSRRVVACEAAPVVEITKILDGTPTLTDGVWTVNYLLTVANTGEVDTTFELKDTPHYGAGVTIVEASVTADEGAPPVAEGWDGKDQPVVVAGPTDIGAGETFTYRVKVTATVDATVTTTESADCTIQENEEGTGFLNRAELGYAGSTVSVVACEPVPALLLEKTAGEATKDKGSNTAYTDAGDTIEYTFLVTNRGAVDLTEVTVDDAKCDAGTLTVKDSDPATTTADLAVGENATFTCTHTIVAAEVTAARVDNTAIATGKDPDGNSVPSPPDSTSTPIPPIPSTPLPPPPTTPTTTPTAVRTTLPVYSSSQPYTSPVYTASAPYSSPVYTSQQASTLPRTGAEMLRWAVTGLGLVTAGGGLVTVGRRRRNQGDDGRDDDQQ